MGITYQGEKSMYQLYLVTQDYKDIDFLQTVEKACQAGVTLVQLREKTLSTRAFYERAKAVKQITDNYNIPLIINDRVDICMAINADGVHIGDDEMPVDVVRQLLPDKIIGVTAKTVARALQAQAQGADYLGVGALFPTQTKDTRQIRKEDLVQIVQSVNIPVVAIGGLTLHNVAIVENTGVCGVALVSEIMRADNVSKRVSDIKKIVGEMVYG